MTSGRIKIYKGKILRTSSGGIATADACCCAAFTCANCCDCAATDFALDLEFAGVMAEFNGVYHAATQDTGEGYCQYNFDAPCPISYAKFSWDEVSCTLEFNARSLAGAVHWYTAMGWTSSQLITTCEGSALPSEAHGWRDDDTPPTDYHMTVLEFYCDAA
ncbi:MAG: hypothetical protein IMZ55_06410 [Acidobacteria bacterium]|nr:hypothetical protein [Acidobacteriota bacterium]